MLPALLVLRAQLEPTALLVLRVLLVLKAAVARATRVLLVPQEPLVLQVPTERMGPMEPTVLLARLVLLVPMEPMEPMGPTVLPALLALMGPTARTEPTVLLVLKVPRVLPALQVRRA